MCIYGCGCGCGEDWVTFGSRRDSCVVHRADAMRYCAASLVTRLIMCRPPLVQGESLWGRVFAPRMQVGSAEGYGENREQMKNTSVFGNASQ